MISQIHLTIGILIVSVTALIITIIKWIRDALRDRYSQGYNEGQRAVKGVDISSKDERILTPSQEIARRIDMIRKARNYIKILAVDGGSWLPHMFDELKTKSKENVEIKVLLLNPNSHINEYLSQKEPKLTKKQHYFPFIIKPNIRRERIEKNYKSLTEIAEVRFYNCYPFWRGIIIDGKYAVYTIVHFPFFGWEAVQRETYNKEIVEHFEEYYFNNAWERAEKEIMKKIPNK